ncbi:MAG: regulatory protein RecX [Smithellaceae bacterium]|nr:regulatory protein RecX [Smithellaceae bacterium]
MPGEDLLGIAMKKAYAILARQDRSEHELTIKLEEKGIEQEIIAEVLAKLISYGYLDDSKYLLAATRRLAIVRRWGNRKIEATLKNKGFTRERIGFALAEVRGEMDEGEALRQLIAKERKKTPEWDEKIKRRLFMRLVSRGFEPSAIVRIMKDFKEEFQDDQWE